MVMMTTLMEVDPSKDMLTMGTIGQGWTSPQVNGPMKYKETAAAAEPKMLIPQTKVARFSLLATFSSCQKGNTMAA
jgi:hypothetical protein